jgi:hypothetical protein
MALSGCGSSSDDVTYIAFALSARFVADVTAHASTGRHFV